MKLAMIGLGRMGGNMVKRLEADGHELATYARSGGGTAESLEELVGQLEPTRVVWMMVPAGDPTQEVVDELLGLLDEGDVIVDGGNSNFRDSQKRHAVAAEHGIRFVDAGVSGGIWGREVGYCLMVGGDDEAVAEVEPAFRSLAPEDGYAHVGPSGAGHFVKMVHNGIEYGLMQAYAEGFEVMAKSELDLDLKDDRRHLALRLGRPLVAPRAPRTRRSRRTRTWTRSAATSRTRARGAGRSRRRSTRTCRFRSSARRSSRASRRGRTSRSRPR